MPRFHDRSPWYLTKVKDLSMFMQRAKCSANASMSASTTVDGL